MGNYLFFSSAITSQFYTLTSCVLLISYQLERNEMAACSRNRFRKLDFGPLIILLMCHSIYYTTFYLHIAHTYQTHKLHISYLYPYFIIHIPAVSKLGYHDTDQFNLRKINGSLDLKFVQ